MGISDLRSKGPHRKREDRGIRIKMKTDPTPPKKVCSSKEKPLVAPMPTFSVLAPAGPFILKSTWKIKLPVLFHPPYHFTVTGSNH